ncbi:CDP-alcohol phosphatidyltransferase family protein [Vineibacter terrae]|uniref:CDP-alcohol phosphatidyltransferase family protein n=1 Tax=Vineibacter terrae TaxID=2586908 RepID=A0A5C8PKG9_9HYPH|nr:CDP-alcohol phosphatidyltransferase family protein [Vineibacter terrae]TXL74165.1 CDP-alcohol phosphatidyltransferase family protein [Vineibacter terrae]
MHVWIDAAAAAPGVTVFGMSPIERHVRAALRGGVPAAHVVIDSGERPPPPLPADLARLGLRLVGGQGDTGARLAAFTATVADTVFAVAGDSVVDPRLFVHLATRQVSLVVTGDTTVPRALARAWSAVYGGWSETGSAADCAVLLAPGVPVPAAADMHALGAGLLAAGTAQRLTAEGFDAHVALQRRDVPFWVRRIGDAASRAAVERFLFDASYKGSTDVFTRYVYPYLVWPLTRLATRWRVHPNTITWVGIVATFAAVPCFALGWWAWGFVLAYVMSVLDSVDGKVARLTFTSSALGNVLDHGLDIVHPPFWYAAWAIGLIGVSPQALWQGGGASDPLVGAAIALLALYVADRLVLAVYKWRYKGRGLHAHAPIDGAVRAVIARRNIFLPLFLAGVALGLGRETFWLILAWQAATVTWHAGRTVWILARKEAPRGVH